MNARVFSLYSFSLSLLVGFFLVACNSDSTQYNSMIPLSPQALALNDIADNDLPKDDTVHNAPRTGDKLEEFIVAPYLFTVNESVINIGWQYIADSKFDVSPMSLTLTTSNGSQQVSVARDGDLWIAKLPMQGCGFGKMTYLIPGMPAPVEIREIPCPNTHAHFKLALIADAQEYPEYVGKLSQQMKDEQVTALLSAGDMVQEGRIFQDWLDYFNVTNILGGSVLTLPAIGNHEYRSDSSNRLWSHFFQKPSTFAYYSFYIGDAHIIVLNSGFEDEPIVMLPQLPWLEAQLLMPAKWKIVMFHHAVYSKGTFNSPLSPLKEFEHLQNLYVPMFELHGVDLVLTGHTHIYERSLKNGIQYVVAGPAGGKMGFYGAENKYSLFSSRDRTVTYLDVSEKELRIRTKNIDGSIIDGVNLSK